MDMVLTYVFIKNTGDEHVNSLSPATSSNHEGPFTATTEVTVRGSFAALPDPKRGLCDTTDYGINGSTAFNDDT